MLALTVEDLIKFTKENMVKPDGPVLVVGKSGGQCPVLKNEIFVTSDGLIWLKPSELPMDRFDNIKDRLSNHGRFD